MGKERPKIMCTNCGAEAIRSEMRLHRTEMVELQERLATLGA